ncbi:hypothetical protein QMA02_24215 [Bacillus wiedmannii]|nr:hypothetical protein [Bacillus wiedmannii]MDI6678913.1 hypothetical protein [Bacillus wiedmannii]
MNTIVERLDGKRYDDGLSTETTLGTIVQRLEEGVSWDLFDT